MNFLADIFKPIYSFLISLRLAVILIVSLMAALIAGTIIESKYGADAAKLLVYDTAWLSVILCLLGLNVLTVAISRWPWKKKHTGFLLTHLGIILMLAGSLVTRYTMTDGQMVLQEGESSSSIMLSQPVLELHERGKREGWLLPVPGKPFPWDGRQKIKSYPQNGTAEIHLLSFYPKAKMKPQYVASEDGAAALEVKVFNSQMDETYWLIEDDPESGMVNLGPSRIVFTKELLGDKSKDSSLPLFLNFQFGERQIRVDLPQDMQIPYRFSISGTPYEGELRGLFRNAVVAGRELVERPGAEQDWENPAVKLTITGPELKEDHTIFSNFPDFGAMHGHSKKASGLKILFHAPHAGLKAAENELRFIKGADGKLIYQVKNKDKVRQGNAVPGEEIATGWMAVKLKVNTYYPHASQDRVFEPRPNTAKAGDLIPAVRIEMARGADKKIVWLGSGMTQRLSLGDAVYEILFGRARQPLDFSLRLKDFQKKDYPGTNKAASFSSDVELIDASRNLRRDVHISMNEPLDYRGYKFYQSAFRSTPGQPEISIFSVANDPGIPLKYAGAIIMVIGILVMMMMKKYPKQRKVSS